ncbi:hypothetical protein HNR44_002225 [Geomicrobium halophilum]|uniref:DUF3231 family protein n=1 Tax=Geomicrobium halophilum TaxID=549000 RepID=A0A841PZN4_9BACL|nr:DUF3231 family protein [Geomicrobium halophilum]MBB6450242.1 hypothetical protein [Geomicrobium halophilum]
MESHKLLTSSEMGSLWTTYMVNSMFKCFYTYGLQLVAEDEDIPPLVQEAYDQSVQNMDTIRTIFEGENFPVPVGFTEHDVNSNAKPLYDDTFFLDYLNKNGKLATPQYASFHATATRKDVRDFFAKCLTDNYQMYDKTTELMLTKGLLIRPPTISIPRHVDFVDRQTYKGSFLIFNDKRPLNAIEISHIYTNLETNLLGFMVCGGFGQTAESQKVRDFMLKGKDIAKQHIKTFSDKLLESDIQSPMTWDAATLDSTEPPFSDKLMMFLINSLIQQSVGRYGVAAGASLRNDLPAMYTKLTAEIASYANDGMDIMIDNQWMEEPPRADDRDKIIKQKN